MMENLMLPQEELFNEVVGRALAEGINNPEAFAQMVADVIEERRSVGEMHDDQGLERIETELTSRWPEYEARLNDRTA